MKRRCIMTPKSHDTIAKQLEKELKIPYNPSKGPDFKKGGKIIEVEPTPQTFTDGIRQVKNYKGLRYLATDDTYMNQLVQRIKGTKLGAMKPNGTIVKPAIPARRKK